MGVEHDDLRMIGQRVECGVNLEMPECGTEANLILSRERLLRGDQHLVFDERRVRSCGMWSSSSGW